MTTVGYGDFKGYIKEEYLFQMAVEFMGIAFFSFIMGSINNDFLKERKATDIIDEKLEEVDMWLVQLDTSRSTKSLPKVLYDKIKNYIS